MSSGQGTGGEAHRGDAGEKTGVFEAHRWLTPVVVIGSIIAAFVAMIVLTWVAGGSTPFSN